MESKQKTRSANKNILLNYAKGNDVLEPKYLIVYSINSVTNTIKIHSGSEEPMFDESVFIRVVNLSIEKDIDIPDADIIEAYKQYVSLNK